MTFTNPRGNAGLDPFTYSEYGTFPDYKDNNGFTRTTSVALVGGQKTHIILVNGDSTAGNCTNTQGSVSSSLVQHVDPKTGGVYKLKDPNLGTFAGTPSTAGSLFSYLGDKLLSGGNCARVVFVNHSIPGTFAMDFCTPGFYTSQNSLSANACRFWDRIPMACHRADQLGLTPTLVILQFGANSANASVTQANETAALQNLIAAYQVHAPAAKIIVPYNTFISGSLPSGSTAIRAAQLAVRDGTIVLSASVDLDTLTGAKRHDGTHWNATGASEAADLYVTAVPTL